MDESNLERFGEAVEEKKRAADEASRATHPDSPGGSAVSGDERDLYEHGRPQDTLDERAKNAGHGKKTADKWNQ